MNANTITPEAADRLLCAIYPTSPVRFIDEVKEAMWRLEFLPPFRWCGDRLDDLSTFLTRRRSARRMGAKA